MLRYVRDTLVPRRSVMFLFNIILKKAKKKLVSENDADGNDVVEPCRL